MSSDMPPPTDEEFERNLHWSPNWSSASADDQGPDGSAFERGLKSKPADAESVASQPPSPSRRTMPPVDAFAPPVAPPAPRASAPAPVGQGDPVPPAIGRLSQRIRDLVDATGRYRSVLDADLADYGALADRLDRALRDRGDGSRSVDLEVVDSAVRTALTPDPVDSIAVEVATLRSEVRALAAEVMVRVDESMPPRPGPQDRRETPGGTVQWRIRLRSSS